MDLLKSAFLLPACCLLHTGQKLSESVNSPTMLVLTLDAPMYKDKYQYMDWIKATERTTKAVVSRNLLAFILVPELSHTHTACM